MKTTTKVAGAAITATLKEMEKEVPEFKETRKAYLSLVKDSMKSNDIPVNKDTMNTFGFALNFMSQLQDAAKEFGGSDKFVEKLMDNTPLLQSIIIAEVLRLQKLEDKKKKK
jgi:hypothetical protein